MAEWSKAPVLKTGVLRGTGGSNPSLSAICSESIGFDKYEALLISPRPTIDTLWRDGRVVECTGLENRRTERYRGFESLSLRYKGSQKWLPFFVYLTTKRVVYQGKSIYLHLNIIYKQRRIKHATCVVRFGDRTSYGINGRYFL